MPRSPKAVEAPPPPPAPPPAPQPSAKRVRRAKVAGTSDSQIRRRGARALRIPANFSNVASGGSGAQIGT
tara:strand:- start:940 stop:1149 length:210 start_codon:yes stop_codon:yes gene_type:complete